MKHTFIYYCTLHLLGIALVGNAKNTQQINSPYRHHDQASLFKKMFIDSSVEGLPTQPDQLAKNTFHLFSHGRPGELLLEKEWLDAKGIAEFIQNNHLLDGHIKYLNIYGCEFGKGTKGKEAVVFLEKTLGILVSASDDITGKGGDWELEIGAPSSTISVPEYQQNLQSCTYGSYNVTPIIKWTSNENADGFTTIDSNTPDDTGLRLFSDGANVVYTSTLNLKGGDVITIRGNYNNDTRRGPLVLSSVGTSALNSGPIMNNAFPVNAWGDVTYTIPPGTAEFSQLNITGATQNGLYVSIDVVSVTRPVCYTCDINIAPTLSATNVINNCSTGTTDLTVITASNTPAGAELTWHTGSPATDANRISNPGATNGSVFFAAFHSSNGCYSGMSGALTIMVEVNDADCDGVPNKTDLDDDNDGIPDKLECPPYYTNLAVDGGFTKDGSALSNWYLARALPSNNYDYEAQRTPSALFGYGDLDGQRNSDLTGGLFDEVDGNNTNTGVKTALSEDPTNPIVGKVGPLGAGMIYDYSFDIALRGNTSTPNEDFVVMLYDATHHVVEKELVRRSLSTLYYYRKDAGWFEFLDGKAGYQTISGSFMANSDAQYYLIFKTEGPQNREDDILIDRVALRQGSPCDTDGDGVPDLLDLDSDGDGCPDAIEGSSSIPASGLKPSSMSGGNAGTNYNGTYNSPVTLNLGKEVDANGVPISANGGQEAGTAYNKASQDPECANVCVVKIGGTIYRDITGASDGVNGTIINGVSGAGSQLYMTLAQNDDILKVTPVSSDGLYLFSNIPPGTYKLVLTNDLTGGLSSSLPGSYKSVAEGGAPNNSGYAAGDGTVDGVTNIQTTCSSFSIFSTGSEPYLKNDFGINDAPLPVTLVSFNAKETLEGTKLVWQTSNEKNFDRFEVEYSVQPKAGFKLLGTVKGGGTNYDFFDPVKRNGNSYYRLKMIDLDGSYTYSRIVTIETRNGIDLNKVYPNPSQGLKIYVETNEAIEYFKVYNITGREIPVRMSSGNDSAEFQFDANTLPGMYILVYKVGDRTINQKFVLSY